MNKVTRWTLAAAGAALTAVLTIAATAATQPPNLRRVLTEQQKLVAEHPYDPAALNDLGNLLQLAGEPAEAEAAYRRALEVAPDMISARYNLALLLQRADRYREALAEYQGVLERAPTNAWAHYQIGAIYEATGEQGRAVRWYGEAFALEPRLAFPEYNPAIIENDLVEEAMLVGYRAEASRPLAPQVYEQPSRIRDLMLPGAAAAEEVVEEAAEEALEEAAEQADEPATAGGAVPETLDAGSLDQRDVNQAAPPGRSPTLRRPAPGTTSVPRRTFRPPPTTGRTGDEGTQAQPGQPGAVGTPGAVIVQPGAPQQPGVVQPRQPRVITPPGVGGSGGRGRRGVGSTGRLELQLVPGDLAAPAPERVG